jgi:hypothetical protein
VFSSHIETYIFSTAAANLLLLAILASDRLGTIERAALQLLASAAAALMHPPLLILNGIAVIRAFKNGKLAVVRQIALCAGVLAAYLAGVRLIHHFSGPLLHLPGTPARGTGILGSELSTFFHYSQHDFWTSFQAGNIIAGQFAYAFAGLHFPCNWSAGLAGLQQYLHHGAAAAALALAAAWAIGLFGLARDRDLRRRSLELLALILLPYLAFYWLFNPGEMFLYSAPLVSALLAWLSRGWQNALAPRRLDLFLLILSLILVLHNSACIASYP